MKQLIIASQEGTVTKNDWTTVPAGQYVLVDMATQEKIAYNKNLAGQDKTLALVLGRGENKMPFVISEIDCKSMTVVESEPSDGNVYAATYTIPTPIAGEAYTLVVVKKGVHFNKRNKYTASTIAVPGDTATTIAKRLSDELKNKFVGAEDELTFNLTVTVNAAVITFTGLVKGEDYALLGADALMGVAATTETEAKPAILDKAWVMNLASQCAAGKGFNFTYEDGASIYPGYPEVVSGDKYDMITLRFAVPRKSAKTRDEVVNQVVHIVTPHTDNETH